MNSLTFYYGTMGAAKSASLLIKRHNFIEKGIETILITPHKDDRFGIGKVKSRVGIEAEADIVLKEEDDLIVEVGLVARERAREKGKIVGAIFVEEAQFLTPKQVEDLAYWVDYEYADVFCYGLKDDFQTKLFPGSKRLIELADSLHEIENLCYTGKKATCNMRIANGKKVEEGEQVEIGDCNYVSVCRKSWTLGKFK